MYQRVMEEMEETCAAIRASGRLFLYAEDWVYAPAVSQDRGNPAGDAATRSCS